ncbi:uncharacterized protein AB675_710 [Cyphellophora attinorum]|uniref:Uncharacterized protein n=1 Tax=Cyphellophora attinorum TaxID=1664694 RepID=A0A0N1HC43_9EURO|nr:uncharacterized protein AB675_710 [Phialophora attinorum]KPI45922.1 hypothetical protein AB675_710 [Phialophora attinorum]
MCTHEIWTYGECGCRVDHHIPCTEARYRDAVLSQCKQHLPSRVSSENGAPENDLVSPLARLAQRTAAASEQSFRSCSINRTVNKSFLEPICEECLLEELHQDEVTGSTEDRGRPAAPQGLVWDSNVKIEVNGVHSEPQSGSPAPQQPPSDTKILESHVEVRISDAGTERTEASVAEREAKEHDSAPTPFSNGDADSESSVPDTSFRGRARSRTKQLRRMAMDVSREDIGLRVSSRLPSFQRHSLQNFKNELQRDVRHVETSEASPGKGKSAKPVRNLIQRFVDAQEETWKKSRCAMAGLRGKMGRKERSTDATPTSSEANSSATVKEGATNSAASPTRVVTNQSASSAESRDVSSSDRSDSNGSVPPENFYLHPDDPFHPNVGQKPHQAVWNHSESSVHSWKDHLSVDLTTKRSRKRPGFVSDSGHGGRPKVITHPTEHNFSTSTTSTAVSSRNWTTTIPSGSSNSFSHQSYEYSTANEDDALYCDLRDEQKRRLLSASSSVPSFPTTTNSDRSVRELSDPLQRRRLASLVASEDFEEPTANGYTMQALNGIEEEMAMVGLIDNPWNTRTRSTSTMEDLPDTPTKVSRQRTKSNGNLQVQTPPNSNIGASLNGNTPVTAVRGTQATSTARQRTMSNESISSFASRVQAAASTRNGHSSPVGQQTHHLSAISACQTFALKSSSTSRSPNEDESSTAQQYALAGRSSPSPTPSPVTPAAGVMSSNALALHSLSTPFHHSLQPRSPGFGVGSIGAVLDSAGSDTTRTNEDLASSDPNRTHSVDNTAIRPLPSTPAMKQNGTRTPEMEQISTLTLNTTSPTCLFSCVWLRELCPGPVSAHGSPSLTPVNGESLRCGRLLTGWKVRSCLCHADGIVRFAVTDTDAKSDDGAFDQEEKENEPPSATLRQIYDNSGNDDGTGEVIDQHRLADTLERECRSVAPVVRYVVGRELCEGCILRSGVTLRY